MRPVALVTCRLALPGSALTAANEDVDAPRLLAACAAQGLDAALYVWDDPTVNWSLFGAIVLRSTWDYAGRRDEFLAWARARENLHNPYDVVEYSTDKHYLLDLADQGVAVVPTTVCEVGDPPAFPDGDFVVKPAVGAGSMDAARYSPRDHAAAAHHVADLHARGRSVIIQPYVSSVDTRGERALIYIDGHFSHAMTKGAMLNTPPSARDALFRREQMSIADAEPDALALGDAIMDTGYRDLCYGRVDLVDGDDGWQLMELELVEPSLFLGFHEPAAARVAAAIARRVR